MEREIDQMRRVMDEMRENMRRANPVEDLVHQTDSPFMASTNGHLLPLKFEMPSLDSYDGTRDPFDHIATFRLRCTFKRPRMKLCVESSLPPSKVRHEYGSVKYPQIQLVLSKS